MKLTIHHELKTWPEYFKVIMSGIKRFEIRKNDRDFKVGDFLILKEFDPKTNTYSGSQVKCKILYILDDPKFVKKGFVIMSIEKEYENQK